MRHIGFRQWVKLLCLPFFAGCLLLPFGNSLAAEIHGIVKNAEGGEPLAKIQVSLVESGARAETGPDGKFRFTALPGGSYTLRLSGVGYRGVTQSFILSSSSTDSKEFEIFLAPDFFRSNEVVEVRGDVFEPPDWPGVGDLNLTSSELQQTSTVAVNDPYRSLQTLPGVSSAANNDLQAQFAVMGAPYENVGVYVDDVRVPNLLHTIPGFQDAASISLFTGNDVQELRLMPVSYPARYAEDAGAALAITTRTGTEGRPAFHFSAGLIDTEGLAEGGFARAHHGTWLISARKSYPGYLDQFVDSQSYSDVGLYDANFKVTYDLTPAHTLSFFATGGQTHVNNPSIPAIDSTVFKGGSNDLVIGRFGWRWQILHNLVLDSRAAYVRSGYEQDNPTKVILSRQLDREFSGGAILSWSYAEGDVLQAGYSNRRPLVNAESNFFESIGPPLHFDDEFAFHSQNAFAQVSQPLWKRRLLLAGGLRWAKQSVVRIEPVTGQASASLRLLADTYVEAGWGKYSQFSPNGGILTCFGPSAQITCVAPLPYRSTQYLAAVEQRIGARSRFRAEAFDRQNVNRGDFYILNPKTLLASAVLNSRDYSHGMQFLFQRRSENRLSGWVGYTLVYARKKQYTIDFPQFALPVVLGTSYEPTLVDQRHNLNLFASYRLTPAIRLGVKNLYGSGFPFATAVPNFRLHAYERLDLRVDKSWLMPRGKFSLYGELLNATNHYNPVFEGFVVEPNGLSLATTSQGVPITPTVGIAFDF